MSVQLLRNTRLWASTVKIDQVTGQPVGALDNTNTWEVLIQDDFAFNQDGNSTDINLDEAGPRPTRGSKRFNDNLNPADWNFSTYLRPYLDKTSSVVMTPDYMLWHCLASGSAIDVTKDEGVKANSKNMLVKFTDNQYHQLNTLTLYYLIDKVWYRIEEVQINQAEISVDIEGIGMTAWSGQGTKVTPLGTSQPFDPSHADFTFPDAIFEEASWIKNKLTTLLIKDKDNGDTEYDIPITGGTVTINNNISYLTPNTLSRLDLPIGSFTGTFEVSGSLEAYLRSRDLDDTTDKAAELLNRMITDRSITNSFEIGICLGGIYDTAAPAVVVVLPTAHLSVPTTETADVLGTNIEFKGIPSELDAGNEVFLGMSPSYTRDQINALMLKQDGAATVTPTPSITTQPTSKSIAAGASLTLSVVATNAAKYQWYHNNVLIPSATSATYTKAKSVTGDAGRYYVDVYNSDGIRVPSSSVPVTIT